MVLDLVTGNFHFRYCVLFMIQVSERYKLFTWNGCMKSCFRKLLTITTINASGVS